MRAAITRRDNDVHVAIAGAVDLTCAREVSDTLTDALAHSKTLVLDLSAVDFIDSTGLAALVSKSVVKGADITVENPSPRVLRLLTITGVDRVVRVA